MQGLDRESGTTRARRRRERRSRFPAGVRDGCGMRDAGCGCEVVCEACRWVWMGVCRSWFVGSNFMLW